MKKFYNLCNFQFINIGIKTLLICAGMLAFQLIALSGQRFSDGIRLEQFMQRAGYHIMFFIAYILILVIIAVSIYQKYFNAKSI